MTPSSQRLRELGWRFKLEEVSANAYLARGHDADGRTVEATGADPDLLLEQCKRDAIKMLDAPDASRS